MRVVEILFVRRICLIWIIVKNVIATRNVWKKHYRCWNISSLSWRRINVDNGCVCYEMSNVNRCWYFWLYRCFKFELDLRTSVSSRFFREISLRIWGIRWHEFRDRIGLSIILAFIFAPITSSFATIAPWRVCP